MEGVREAKKTFTLAKPYQVKSASHRTRDIGRMGHATSDHVGLKFAVLVFRNGWNSIHVKKRPVGCSFHDGYAQPLEEPVLCLTINEKETAKSPYQEALMPFVRRKGDRMCAH